MTYHDGEGSQAPTAMWGVSEPSISGEPRLPKGTKSGNAVPWETALRAGDTEVGGVVTEGPAWLEVGPKQEGNEDRPLAFSLTPLIPCWCSLLATPSQNSCKGSSGHSPWAEQRQEKNTEQAGSTCPVGCFTVSPEFPYYIIATLRHGNGWAKQAISSNYKTQFHLVRE